jgi:hypothetical protein
MGKIMKIKQDTHEYERDSYKSLLLNISWMTAAENHIP